MTGENSDEGPRAVDPDPVRIQAFDDQKLKKKMQPKIFFYLFLNKKRQLLLSKLKEEPPVLKREHRALQKMQFVHFFLCLWVIFALLDPDPDC